MTSAEQRVRTNRRSGGIAHDSGASSAKRTANATGASSEASDVAGDQRRRPAAERHVLGIGLGAVGALPVVVGVHAFVEKRGDEQRHADERVPRERERGHVALRAMRDLVNEEHRAVEREDRDGEARSARSSRR